MTRVVVTGATGFVGRALCNELATSGFDVVRVARHDAPDAGLQVVSVYQDLDADSAAVLVHLAEPSAMATLREDPSVSSQLHGAMLALLAKGWRKVLYASSAAVYGDRGSSPSQVGSPTVADNPYAALKVANEGACLAAGGTVMRIANVYGPGMSKRNVMSDIIAQLGTSGPVRVGDVTPTRDFIAVGDVVSAIVALLRSAERGVFNVGTGVGTSIEALAQTILRVAGTPSRPVVSTAKHPPAVRSYLVLDSAETTRRTGWQPRIALQEGLDRLLRSP